MEDTQLINILMEKLNCTANEMAEQLAVSPATISNLRNGKTSPSFEVLQKIMRTYPQINADWLLTREGNMFKGNITPPEKEQQLPYKDNVLGLFQNEDTKKENINPEIIHNNLNKETINSKESEKYIQKKEDDSLPKKILDENVYTEKRRENEENKKNNNKKIVKIIIYFEDNTYEELLIKQ